MLMMTNVMVLLLMTLPMAALGWYQLGTQFCGGQFYPPRPRGPNRGSRHQLCLGFADNSFPTLSFGQNPMLCTPDQLDKARRSSWIKTWNVLCILITLCGALFFLALLTIDNIFTEYLQLSRRLWGRAVLAVKRGANPLLLELERSFFSSTLHPFSSPELAPSSFLLKSANIYKII